MYGLSRGAPAEDSERSVLIKDCLTVDGGSPKQSKIIKKSKKPPKSTKAFYLCI